MTETRIMGLTVCATTQEDAARLIVKRAASRRGGYACFCNVHVLVSSLNNGPLRDALDKAAAVFPDGAPLAWLQRRAGATGAERVPGPDVMLRVFQCGQKHRVRHLLFGSTSFVLQRMMANIRDLAPDAVIVDAVAPRMGKEDEPSILAQLRRAEADIVWVGLGAPKQELWMSRHAASLEPALLVGVGAAFDFHAGTTKRAPVWMRDSGLEWLYRLCTEPRRLARRYVSTNVRFLMKLPSELRMQSRDPSHR